MSRIATALACCASAQALENGGVFFGPGEVVYLIGIGLQIIQFLGRFGFPKRPWAVLSLPA